MNALIESTPQETEDLAQEAGPRILIVEDDTDIRCLATEALVRSGYEVDAAENGARGWKALHLKPYDLVITDHDMPEMTGLQMVHKLRLVGMAMPVILMSGSSMPAETLQMNSRLGFAAMLEKPFSLEELIETVQVILPPAAGPAAAAASIRSFPGRHATAQDFRRS